MFQAVVLVILSLGIGGFKIKIMRTRIYLAIILNLLGLITIIDWYVFWHENEKLALQDFRALSIKYVERFPEIIQPLLTMHPRPLDVIFIIGLITSGIILILEKKTIFTIIGLTSFLYALQFLFSIM